jgi:hypothetical protein
VLEIGITPDNLKDSTYPFTERQIEEIRHLFEENGIALNCQETVIPRFNEKARSLLIKSINESLGKNVRGDRQVVIDKLLGAIEKNMAEQKEGSRTFIEALKDEIGNAKRAGEIMGNPEALSIKVKNLFMENTSETNIGPLLQKIALERGLFNFDASPDGKMFYDREYFIHHTLNFYRKTVFGEGSPIGKVLKHLQDILIDNLPDKTGRIKSMFDSLPRNVQNELYFDFVHRTQAGAKVATGDFYRLFFIVEKKFKLYGLPDVKVTELRIRVIDKLVTIVKFLPVVAFPWIMDKLRHLGYHSLTRELWNKIYKWDIKAIKWLLYSSIMDFNYDEVIKMLREQGKQDQEIIDMFIDVLKLKGLDFIYEIKCKNLLVYLSAEHGWLGKLEKELNNTRLPLNFFIINLEGYVRKIYQTEGREGLRNFTAKVSNEDMHIIQEYFKIRNNAHYFEDFNDKSNVGFWLLVNLQEKFGEQYDWILNELKNPGYARLYKVWEKSHGNESRKGGTSFAKEISETIEGEESLNDGQREEIAKGSISIQDAVVEKLNIILSKRGERTISLHVLGEQWGTGVYFTIGTQRKYAVGLHRAGENVVDVYLTNKMLKWLKENKNSSIEALLMHESLDGLITHARAWQEVKKMYRKGMEDFVKLMIDNIIDVKKIQVLIDEYNDYVAGKIVKEGWDNFEKTIYEYLQLQKLRLNYRKRKSVAKQIVVIAERELNIKMDHKTIEKIQSVLAKVKEAKVTLMDILAEISDNLTPEQLLTLGDEISKLESLNELLGQDALDQGGQVVLSILDEIVKSIGGEVKEGERREEAFRRVLKEMGVSNSETQSIFTLLSTELSKVLESGQPLDENVYDCIKAIAETSGLTEDSLLRAYMRDYLGDELNKFKFNSGTLQNLSGRLAANLSEKDVKVMLVNIAMKGKIDDKKREMIEKTLKAKGLWERFDKLLKIKEAMQANTIIREEQLDSPILNIIMRVRFYSSLKAQVVGDIRKSELGKDPEVDRIIRSSDYADEKVTVSDEADRQKEQVGRFSEGGIIEHRLQELLESIAKDDDTPRVISIPIESVFPEIKQGGNKVDLTYLAGLTAFINLLELRGNRNVEIALQVKGLGDAITGIAGIENRRQLIESLLRIGRLESKVFITEEVTRAEQLVVAQGDIIAKSRLEGLKNENIAIFTYNDLSKDEGFKNVVGSIKSSQIKVFGIDRASQLPALLMLGYKATTINVFENEVLSEAMQTVLKQLGMTDADIKNIVESGTAFIQVKLIRITEVLEELRQRRVTIDIAA